MFYSYMYSVCKELQRREIIIFLYSRNVSDISYTYTGTLVLMEQTQ